MTPENPELRKAHSDHPRVHADLTYAYPVVSRRSGGVSIGVNVNLDKRCNFDCPYCQVDRTVPGSRQDIDPARIAQEVGFLLDSVDAGGVCRLEKFAALPDEAKRLKDIALSGDGEPTMIPGFAEVCAALAGLQATRPDLDCKLILITNSTLLDRPGVLAGIDSLLSRNGEVWAKLDAGTEEWFQKVNISRLGLDRIEANIIGLGRKHPFFIQSMFHAIDGTPPPAGELDAYLGRLRRIRDAGSRIREVQLYTVARKPAQPSCTPVAREFLEALRGRIEADLQLAAKVYGVPE